MPSSFSLVAAIPAATPAGPIPAATTADWIMLAVYLGAAVGVSFLCSLLEAGLLSVSAGHVASMEARGSATGTRLAKLKRELDRPLAAILTLNTIAHTVGAAGTGAQSLKLFGDKSVAIVSAIVTLIILVFSEIIPKSLGAAHAQRLAPFTAAAVQAMIVLTLPLVVPLQYVSRLFGGGHRELLSRPEVASIAAMGLADGVLQPEESRVIQNLIGLSEVVVDDVMTPRTVAFALSEDLTVQSVVEDHSPLLFSRIPVFRETFDHCTGVVTRNDILLAHAQGQREQPLSALAKPILRVRLELDVATLLRRLIAKNQHLALVTDEFGCVDGVVTLEDCLETLLGTEIVDETDAHPDMRELARELMKKRRGRLRVPTPVAEPGLEATDPPQAEPGPLPRPLAPAEPKPEPRPAEA